MRTSNSQNFLDRKQSSGIYHGSLPYSSKVYFILQLCHEIFGNRVYKDFLSTNTTVMDLQKEFF